MKVRAYIDGSSLGNPGPAGIGIVVKNEDETAIIMSCSHKIGISKTNNEAEYEALINLVKMLNTIQPEFAFIFSDSKLLVNQINGIWQCKQEHIRNLHEIAINELQDSMNDNWSLLHISREFNKEADILAGKASKAQKDEYL